MNLDSIPAGLDVVIPALLFVFLSLQKWKRGLTDTWREIAEAQAQRAELLEKQVQELTVQVTALRIENAELRGMLSAAQETTPERSGVARED